LISGGIIGGSASLGPEDGAGIAPGPADREGDFGSGSFFRISFAFSSALSIKPKVNYLKFDLMSGPLAK
jgi:hypothetical protein